MGGVCASPPAGSHTSTYVAPVCGPRQAVMPNPIEFSAVGCACPTRALVLYKRVSVYLTAPFRRPPAARAKSRSERQCQPLADLFFSSSGPQRAVVSACEPVPISVRCLSSSPRPDPRRLPPFPPLLIRCSRSSSNRCCCSAHAMGPLEKRREGLSGMRDPVINLTAVPICSGQALKIYVRAQSRSQIDWSRKRHFMVDESHEGRLDFRLRTPTFRPSSSTAAWSGYFE